MSPLAFMKEGETAEIVGEPLMRRLRHHHGHCCGNVGPSAAYDARCHRGGPGHDHLNDMGLRPGKRVQMIANSGTGPLILLVDESRIALGRGVAMKIYVRRIEA
ncbi:MAG: ferrous iron transport protein A [Deltaproteobacteria bacterium]|nr:ferrous iron transport protein A [Deltaproteobacteria bacterium]